MPGRAQEDLQFWKYSEPLINKALSEVNALSPQGPVAQVGQLLLNRLIGTVHVLLTLGLYHQNSFDHEAATLLRAAYDAYVQAVYVLVDRDTAGQKAQDYLDFYYVERHLFLKKLEKTNNIVSKHVLNSPLRAQNEAHLDATFERVKARFESAHRNRFRRNWYVGDLRELADKIGIVDEYDLVISRVSPSVHSSPYAMRMGAGVPTQHITFFVIRLVFRLVGAIGAHYALVFNDQEVRDAIESFGPGLFEPPKFHR